MAPLTSREGREPAPGSIGGPQRPTGSPPALPPELEKEIFLLTARAHRSVSTRLMLVAYRVKSWIEPFVYNTVVLHVPERAIRFLDALVSHRTPEFVQSHVKALCITLSIPLKLALRLLATCPGLESLVLWISPQSDTVHLLSLVSSLPLTFLSINLPSILPSRYTERVLQNHPVYVHLTHLDVVNNWVLCTSSLGIEHLPRLTHVAFRLWPRGRISGALSKILQESPRLEVLVFLANAVVLPGATRYLEQQDVRDPRVVVLQHARDADDWEMGSVTTWQRADVVVRWRLRHQAGPYDYPLGFSFGSTDYDAFTSSREDDVRESHPLLAFM